MRRMPAPVIPDDSLDRLRRLGAFIPELESSDFDFGHWAGGERLADGSSSVPYYEFSARAQELIAALPVIVGFEWPAWLSTPRAKEFVENHDRIGEAGIEDLVRLTTAIVRSDRFTEGSIAGAYESGLLLAIARRAKTLADARNTEFA